MAQKILIIEDDIFLAEVLMNRLRSENFEVMIADNGKDGMSKIREYKPDLVLLDIILPGMNGYEILEEKHRDMDIVDIPVIIVSNSGQPVEVKRALSLGVKGYLIKAQIDPDEVVECVKRELENNRSSGMGASATLTQSAYISPQVSDIVQAATGITSLKGRNILWVEDDRFLKDLITMRLANEGCKLFHAKDETEAFALLEKNNPDIILLDILLPGADGFTILDKLRKDPRFKNVPIILLSNLSQPADLDKGKRLGANKFLVKSSVTLDEIIEEIKSVIH